MNLKPEDKLLFDKVLDKMEAARRKYSAAFTDFMDPYRCGIFLSGIRRGLPISSGFGGINDEAFTYGGYDGAERLIIGFSAPGESLVESDFPITPVALTYNEKFSKAPSHRDYLGAVLGLGLDRGKIGDIRIAPAGAVMYVQTDIADFIAENLQKAGRTAIKAAVGQELPGLEAIGANKRVTVPSLRVDAVLSAAFNMPRSKAAALVEGEKVFVNWMPAKKAQVLSQGDTLTVRGFGRVIVGEEGGRTKKDRVVVNIVKF